jgi:hypothetical protein
MHGQRPCVGDFLAVAVRVLDRVQDAAAEFREGFKAHHLAAEADPTKHGRNRQVDHLLSDGNDVNGALKIRLLELPLVVTRRAAAYASSWVGLESAVVVAVATQ